MVEAIPGAVEVKVERAPEAIGPVHPLAIVEPMEAEPFRPWDRLPRETDSAWSLFLVFRDMAYPDGPLGRFVPRNVSAMAGAVGLSVDRLHDLSGTFHWFKRAGAFDQALDRAKTEADISEVSRTRTRHLRLMAKARAALEAELDKWLRRTQDPEVPTLDPKDVMKGLELIIKSERLLVGEHTDAVRVDRGDGWDLESLALEDLEALDAIRRKARGT